MKFRNDLWQAKKIRLDAQSEKAPRHSGRRRVVFRCFDTKVFWLTSFYGSNGHSWLVADIDPILAEMWVCLVLKQEKEKSLARHNCRLLTAWKQVANKLFPEKIEKKTRFYFAEKGGIWVKTCKSIEKEKKKGGWEQNGLGCCC